MTVLVGISPNGETIFTGAIVLEQSDELAVQRGRYMALETVSSLSDTPIVGLPTVTAWATRLKPAIAVIMLLKLHHVTGHDRNARRKY
jgi:hypothetical protein